MNKNPQNLRRHAAEQFAQSLDQELLGAFQEDDETTPSPSCPPPELKPPAPKMISASKPAKPISLSDLEDAISDIEQYLQSRQKRLVSPEEE